ncbi:glycosyltransferase family 2 protein [Leucothrix pacifica]|uniref:Glycosyltransferase 2-like domain-containing protein n=1 Tax=Leucothrix pacifica TaxID=1247513 RepID=A0A317CCF6_9GAMM|nr:glycosyltransferase [Leucothrix pacifica]PWQ95801.1 hypothetical protein DKW60_13950 [Leucothrix pacifica]
MKFKYSIVIPTFKREKLLIEALESAVNQRYSKELYEIVVCNNNPEEDSVELHIKRCNTKYIKYIKNKKNLGMVGNWNHCVRQASGSFIVMLHDDDILCENHLEKLDQIIGKDHSLDPLNTIIGFDVNIFSDSKSVRKDGVITGSETVSHRSLLWKCPFSMTGLTINRVIFEKYGFFNESYYSADHEFYYRVSRLGGGLLKVYGDLGNYRINSNISLNKKTLLAMIVEQRNIFSSSKEYSQIEKNASNFLLKIRTIIFWKKGIRFSVREIIESPLYVFYIIKRRVESKL